MFLDLITLLDHALYLYQILGKMSNSVSHVFSGYKNVLRGIIQ